MNAVSLIGTAVTDQVVADVYLELKEEAKPWIESDNLDRSACRRSGSEGGTRQHSGEEAQVQFNRSCWSFAPACLDYLTVTHITRRRRTVMEFDDVIST